MSKVRRTTYTRCGEGLATQEALSKETYLRTKLVSSLQALISTMAKPIVLQTYPIDQEAQELMQGLSNSGDETDSVFDHSPQEKGKPSPIKAYCEAALRKCGDQRHLWICIRRGKQTIAHDVAFPEDKTLGIVELRKYCGWFKRYFSLYSVTAMQEVKVS